MGIGKLDYETLRGGGGNQAQLSALKKQEKRIDLNGKGFMRRCQHVQTKACVCAFISS